MLGFSRAKLTALIGYTLAGSGMILYTQLDRIVDLRVGDNVLNVAALGSMTAMFGGFVAATVGSAIWARRSSTRQPLKIAFSIGVAGVLLALLVGVNIHGPSAMLMFLVLFSVINILSVLIASGW